MEKWNGNGIGAYSNPGAVEIGLIVAGDDLLDEVPSGTEMTSFSEKKRGFGVV